MKEGHKQDLDLIAFANFYWLQISKLQICFVHQTPKMKFYFAIIRIFNF